MMDFIHKLGSRKFLACVAGIVLGICMMFGVDEGTASTIAGGVMSVGSAITYMIVEGNIDAKSFKQMTDGLYDIVEVVDDKEDGTEC
jgi:hypothetical protein